MPCNPRRLRNAEVDNIFVVISEMQLVHQSGSLIIGVLVMVIFSVT